MDGDSIEIEVEGLGRLAVSVSDPLDRVWPRHSRCEHEAMGLEGRFAAQISGKYAPEGK